MKFTPAEVVEWLRGMKIHSVYADRYEAAAQMIESLPVARHWDTMDKILGTPPQGSP